MLFGLFGSGKQENEPEGLIWQEGDLEVEIDMSQGMYTSWDVQCASCLAEQGLPMGNGSHGLCEYHAQQMLQTWRQR